MLSNPPRFLIIIAVHPHPEYSFLIRAFVTIRAFVAHSFIIRAHKNAKCRKDQTLRHRAYFQFKRGKIS